MPLTLPVPGKGTLGTMQGNTHLAAELLGLSEEGDTGQAKPLLIHLSLMKPNWGGSQTLSFSWILHSDLFNFTEGE